MTNTFEPSELKITHNPAANRFEALIPGAREDQLAVVEYRRQDDSIYVTRTYTPPAFRGRGIAAAVTEAVLAYAQEEALAVVPVCSYTVAYVANQTST